MNYEFVLPFHAPSHVSPLHTRLGYPAYPVNQCPFYILSIDVQNRKDRIHRCILPILSIDVRHVSRSLGRCLRCWAIGWQCRRFERGSREPSADDAHVEVAHQIDAIVVATFDVLRIT